MDIKELRSKLGAANDKIQAMFAKVDVEKRDALNDAEMAEFNTLTKEAEALKVSIAAAERAAALNVEVRGATSAPIVFPVGGAGGAGGEQRGNDKAGEEYRKAFNNYLRGGETRDLSVGSVPGAYLVHATLYDRMAEIMKYIGGVRAAGAQMLVSDEGHTLDFSISNDTANEGVRLNGTGAGTAKVSVDPNITQKALITWLYSSNPVILDRAALTDSTFDVASYLANNLALRLARITNKEYTNGTGPVGMPEGVLTAATQGLVGASATDVTVQELISLVYAVDQNYRMNGKWMLNDTTLKLIMGKQDTMGRPLFMPPANGVPGTILGYEYVINNHMPNVATGAKPILFGDFSQYLIKDVRGFAIERLDETYKLDGKVGFVLFARTGGILNNDGSAIKFFKNL